MFFGGFKDFRNIKNIIFQCKTVEAFKDFSLEKERNRKENIFVFHVFWSKSKFRFKDWQIFGNIIAINVISFSHAFQSINQKRSIVSSNIQAFFAIKLQKIIYLSSQETICLISAKIDFLNEYPELILEYI